MPNTPHLTLLPEDSKRPNLHPVTFIWYNTIMQSSIEQLRKFKGFEPLSRSQAPLGNANLRSSRFVRTSTKFQFPTLAIASSLPSRASVPDLHARSVGSRRSQTRSPSGSNSITPNFTPDFCQSLAYIGKHWHSLANIPDL